MTDQRADHVSEQAGRGFYSRDQQKGAKCHDLVVGQPGRISCGDDAEKVITRLSPATANLRVEVTEHVVTTAQMGIGGAGPVEIICDYGRPFPELIAHLRGYAEQFGEHEYRQRRGKVTVDVGFTVL